MTVMMTMMMMMRAPPEPSRADPDLHSLRGPLEQLLSKKASQIVVKHGENENSTLKTNKKQSKTDFFDLQFPFSLCFHSHYFRDLALYEVFLQSELSRDVFFTF